MCYTYSMIRDLYQKLYERQAAFYRKRPWARKTLFIANSVLTAAVFLAYAFLCLFELIIHNPVRADVVRILGVPLLCLFAVSLLRNLIDRKRPYEAGGIFPVIQKKKRGHSFPSRHVASAFVIGTVLLPYCVWAGAAVLLAGTLLGYVRFAAGIHYPSDLLAGAALGIVFGLMAFI